MKKIDYYAAPSSGMPKWLGVVLGGVFATIALGCVVVIVALTRDNTPPPAPEKPVLAATVEAPTAEQIKAPRVAAASPSDEDKAPAKVSSRKSAKQSKAAKRLAAKNKRAGKMLLAKHTTSAAEDRNRAILAKRDTKQSRKAKDDLDKLLGL
jgi:hypothetical protein